MAAIHNNPDNAPSPPPGWRLLWDYEVSAMWAGGEGHIRAWGRKLGDPTTGYSSCPPDPSIGWNPEANWSGNCFAFTYCTDLTCEQLKVRRDATYRIPKGHEVRSRIELNAQTAFERAVIALNR